MDGTTLHSQDGTTQGDSLAMSMYALALLPLIKNVNSDLSATQVWYADDATAAGSISNLYVWWDALVTLGLKFGYYVNPSKTHLITKEGHHSMATEVFKDTEVKVTSEGKTHLGAALGTSSFTEVYICKDQSGEIV